LLYQDITVSNVLENPQLSAMSKPSVSREPHEIETYLQAVKGDAVLYPQFFALLSEAIPHALGMVITSLPRGSLQIAQPASVPEPLLKSYTRDFHAFDRPSWTAISIGAPTRATDCWETGQYESSKYLREFLAPNGFRFAAAAPLAGPVLNGYPGALMLFRSQEQGPFSNADLTHLGQIAAELDEAINRTRSVRRARTSTSKSLRPRARIRQFVFDRELRARIGKTDLANLDDRLRQQILDMARQRLAHVNGKATTGDRVSLPDSNGDLWVFRVVVHRNYPALGEGPFVFFNLQPDNDEWSVLRANDFQADIEISRLIPALRFMEHEFHRGPTLGEIARTVHLSPFHFHRRFTELLGITPKHFLLDCQIEEAKRQLLARQKDLAEIAKSCGFAHQSHFTSRFKQATGLTPTRWRRFATEKKLGSPSEN
jgi:AraC-like DNA-binding protein